MSAIVIGLSGYAWAAISGLIDGLVVADVIGTDGGGDQPADGARDILLVGLDSRTDANGNPLPKEKRKQLRAGKAKGELNTDTLILVHVPNDGSKAVAISLPRDSYVDIPGFGQHKINSAYARGKAVERQRLQAEGVTDQPEIERRSNESGAKTLIATVEQLTGRTIDNYAAVNLIGFYDITQAIGGIEVCLKNAVSDVKSHAEFEAGRQTIQGTDALAFVRQRNGLPRGDLDRVVRQQVFMAGLARETLSADTLTDPGKLNNLLEAIKKSVVLNKGWDIFDFAKRMSGLAGGQIKFATIPVRSADLRTPEDGLAVEVDPAEVRLFIAEFSGAKPAGQPPDESNAEITVNVMNTTTTEGLAASVAGKLAEKGYTTGLVGNAASRADTVVRHAPGEEAYAQRVAAGLGAPTMVEPDPALAAGTMTVLLGADFPSAGALPSGGSSQPQGEQEPPSNGQEPGADKPITAEGVTCVN